MVFEFWRKAPLSLDPGEDVEVTFSPTAGSFCVEIMKVQSQDRDEIVLKVPQKFQGESPFDMDMPLHIYVRKDLMLGNFFTRIEKKSNTKECESIHIPIPDRVRWIKMDSSSLPLRDYKRVEVQVPVEIGYMHNRVKGVTQDLSGGGTQVITSLYVPEEEEIDLRIALPQSSVFTRARVLRCQKIKTKNTEEEKFLLALEFCDISEDSRNRVIYYTINRQEPPSL